MSEFLSSGEENLFSSSNLHSVASADSLKIGSANSDGYGKTPSSKDRDNSDLQTPGSDNFIRSSFQNAVNEQSPDSPEPQSEAVGETDEERRLREERESEALAWELMQQENMELYQLQMQFMQENAHSLSQDDYQAMQMIINESAARPVQQQRTRRVRRVNPSETDSNEEAEEGSAENGTEDGETESYISEEVEEDDEEQDDENDDDDPDNWDYERLLALGQVIGDVKTERWRKRAQDVIKSLPTVQYRDITAQYEVAASGEKKLKRSIDDISASPVRPTTTAAGSASVDSGAGLASSNSCSKESLVSLNSGSTQSSASKNTGSTSGLVCRTSSNHKKQKKCLPSKNRALDHRCAVCMDPFEPEDTLNLLPCQHYFHIPCTEGWLADHNSCPSCKTKISATPEKSS